MSSVHIRRFFRPPWLVAAILLVPICVTHEHTNAGELPLEMNSALERNAQMLSPLTITWERKRQTDEPVAEVLATIKYQSTSVGNMAPEKIHFIWQDGKYYAYWWFHSAHAEFVDGEIVADLTKPLHIVEQETTFDGENYYFGSGLEVARKRGSSALLRVRPIQKEIKESPSREMIHTDYFYHAGLKLPEKPAEHLEGAHSLLLHLLNHGATIEDVRPEQLEGRQCDVVELRSSDWTFHFYLDPALNHATRLWTQHTKSGKLAVRSACSQFTEIAKRGIWLPRRIDSSWYTWPTIPNQVYEEPLIHQSYDVLALATTRVSEDTFVLNYDEAGTYVSNATVDGADDARDGYVRYRIPADPKDLDKVIAAAAKEQAYISSRTWWTWLLIGVNGLALVALFVWWARRARRYS